MDANIKLIVIDGRIVGTTTADDPNGYTLIDPPAGFDGELAALEYDPQTGHARYNLEAYRQRRIDEIRREAAQAIAKWQWRIERASERDRLGLPGETVTDVLLEREAIRRASNRCEGEINAAQDVAAVQAVTFAITDDDRATHARLTRLQFLMRFSDTEMQAIVAAADQNPALKAALLKWQTAEGIVLTDPVTQAGVQALEIAGLIAPGRAQQILSV